MALSIEEILLKKILKAAKECDDPQKIATAYGTLVDKIAQAPKKVTKKIEKVSSAYTKTVSVLDSKKALLIAKKKASKKDMIVVCGSIYLLGEII